VAMAMTIQCVPYSVLLHSMLPHVLMIDCIIVVEPVIGIQDGVTHF